MCVEGEKERETEEEREGEVMRVGMSGSMHVLNSRSKCNGKNITKLK